MLFVITGNGKGKTTSALGMVSRALGHGKNCAVLQFIKTNPELCGEYVFFSSLGVLWKNFGEGFTWKQKDLKKTKELCLDGWNYFKELVRSGKYYMIILDEFTYLLSMNIIDERDVLSFLKEINDSVNIVITGRNASEMLLESADTVSEIKEIKHHYYQERYRNIDGIDY